MRRGTHGTGRVSDPAAPAAAGGVAARDAAPARAALVLGSLIIVAAVANLNLAVANVALPDIARAFDSSQTTLNLIAVGYSLGLAASVLYFGALGDRYGRKMMLVLGMVLSIPACLLAAWAPSDEVLFLARVLGGLSAGMAYPTTLALITALWAGKGRTKAIALWSGIGGAISSLGPLLAGGLLEHFWWGSVFLVTLPLAGVALILAIMFVPSHVNEGTDPVDNLGGILSVVLVAALVLAINFAAVPNQGALTLGLAAIAVAGLGAFLLRERRTPNPLYDLRVAGAPRLLGRRLRRGDRLRDADGGHVHRPAVPPERPRLLDARGGCLDPPGGGLHGARRAALGEAGRGVRRPPDPARRLRLLPRRVRRDAPVVGRRDPVLEGGARLHVRRHRRGLRRHARIALAHRLGARDARRDGLGHRRSPAGPGRRDHAVDPRRAAHGGLRRGRRRHDRRRPRTQTTSPRAWSRS